MRSSITETVKAAHLAAVELRKKEPEKYPPTPHSWYHGQRNDLNAPVLCTSCFLRIDPEDEVSAFSLCTLKRMLYVRWNIVLHEYSKLHERDSLACCVLRSECNAVRCVEWWRMMEHAPGRLRRTADQWQGRQSTWCTIGSLQAPSTMTAM